MSHVVITKKGKHLSKKWKGMPDDHPALIEEFESYEAANAKYPGESIMTIEEYRNHAMHFHMNHPAPKKRSIDKKPWWNFILFWRKNVSI